MGNFLNSKGILYCWELSIKTTSIYGSDDRTGIDHFVCTVHVIFDFLGKFIKGSLDKFQFYH